MITEKHIYYICIILLLFLFWLYMTCEKSSVELNTNQDLVRFNNRYLIFDFPINKSQQICNHPDHLTYKDCFQDLVDRKFHDDCKIVNLMKYTISIRQNISSCKSDFNKFKNDLQIVLSEYPNFPPDNRHIGSFFTNFYQGSTDIEEQNIAQSLNILCQMEKIHIGKVDDNVKEGTVSNMNDVKIYEVLYDHEGEDIYKNLINRDMIQVLRYPILKHLYKNMLRNLLSEPRSITYSMYHHNKTTKSAIDDIIQNW